MPSGRGKIEAMLKLEPQEFHENQFLRFALAREYENEGRHDEAWRIYESLVSDKKPHLASFLAGADLLVTAGRLDEARTFLRSGVEAARARDNADALAEIEKRLAELAGDQ